MMEEVSDIALLQSVLPILHGVAEHLAGESEEAKAAQNAINKNSPLGNCFHATIYTKFCQIQPALWNWSEHKYDNSPAVQKRVRNLFGTLEDMFANRLHRQPPSAGLAYIKGIADSATAVPSDLDDLHSQIQSCLFCPEIEVCDRLVEAVSECAEALDTSRLTSSIRDIAQGEELLSPIAKICDSILKIEDVIKHGLDCTPCGCQHEAVFSFATPCYGKGAFGNCLMSFRSNHSVQGWISAQVAFKQSHENLESRSGARLCKVLLNSSTETHLEPLENGFIEIPVKTQLRKTSAVSLTSFKSWVASGQTNGYAKNSEKHRLILTLLLAYAYLYLGGSSWWPDARLNAGLWFADHLDDKIIRPFLQFSTGEKQKSWSVEGCINEARPSLPAFGRLILEIWLGRPIVLGDEDMLGVEKDCQRSTLGPHIYGIANSCIRPDEILKRKGSFRDNALMRETFASNVVKTLQHISRFVGVAPQQIVELLQAQMQTDSRINQDVTTTEPATCESLPTSSTPTPENSVAATEKQPLDDAPKVTNELSMPPCVSSIDIGKSTLSNASSGCVFVQRYVTRVAPCSF
jgi:hypothetical protein